MSEDGMMLFMVRSIWLDLEIAEKKMPDMNCATVEAAAAMVAGQARSMGIDVEG